MVLLLIIVSWFLFLLSGFDDSVPPTDDKTFKIETRPDIVESIEIISDEKMPFWGFDIELKQNSKDYLEIMIPKNLPTPASFTNKWYHDEMSFVLANGKEVGYDIIDDPCYEIYKIPISNHTKIEFTYAVILGGTWQLYSPVQFDENHPCYHEVFYEKPVDSPLKQFRSGIPIDEIQCGKEMVLITKSSDGSPACVTPDTKQILVERGWAKQSLPPCTSERTACFNQESNMCDPSGWECDNGQVFSKTISLPEPKKYSTAFPYIWNDFLHKQEIEFEPKEQSYINTGEGWYSGFNRVCSPIVASNGTELYISSTFIDEPFEITGTFIDSTKPDDCHKIWKTESVLPEPDRELASWLESYHDKKMQTKSPQ